jgi:hypothetical protein
VRKGILPPGGGVIGSGVFSLWASVRSNCAVVWARLPGDIGLLAGSPAGQSRAVLIPALGEQGGAWPTRRNLSAVGQKLAGVVEEHHSVAKQAPALFWVSGHGAGGVTVGSGRRRTRGNVRTRPRPGAG